MKKLIFVLALVASLQFAGAQNKSAADAKRAVEAAEAAVQNPKKATKVATWIKLAQAYMAAYNAPQGTGWVGAGMQELDLIMTKEKPLAEEQVMLLGQPMLKRTYETCDYYFNGNGVLEKIITTKPVYEDALEKAQAAYAKAAELDVKGSKTKDIKAALVSIATKFTEDAYNAYAFSDYAKSSKMFEAALGASAQAPLSQIDTNAVYNTGLTAWLASDMGKAKTFFQKSLDLGYYSEGDVFVKLADLAQKDGDAALQQKYLEDGFKVFPQSQGILVGLINYYIASGENTSRLFELLDEAKKNEPENASLYYVEGNIHKQLDEIPEAVASYEDCIKINPSYEFGYIGLGALYYDQALKFQDLASNEMDDNKWMALNADFESSLKKCIEPFEKAYDICEDGPVKNTVAEYLKNACFRFRMEGDAAQQKYEKYAAIVEKAQSGN